MHRCCTSLGAFSPIKPCCYVFLVISWHLIVSHTCRVLYVLTLAILSVYCCYALLLRRWRLLIGMRAPDHLHVVWCFIPLCRPLGLVISFVIKLDVINIGYTIYFTIVALCVKFDHGTHKCKHSVLSLKLGVTDLICLALRLDMSDTIGICPASSRICPITTVL
jgi:hypothetical protein